MSTFPVPLNEKDERSKWLATSLSPLNPLALDGHVLDHQRPSQAHALALQPCSSSSSVDYVACAVRSQEFCEASFRSPSPRTGLIFRPSLKPNGGGRPWSLPGEKAVSPFGATQDLRGRCDTRSQPDCKRPWRRQRQTGSGIARNEPLLCASAGGHCSRVPPRSLWSSLPTTATRKRATTAGIVVATFLPSATYSGQFLRALLLPTHVGPRSLRREKHSEQRLLGVLCGGNRAGRERSWPVLRRVRVGLKDLSPPFSCLIAAASSRV
uniref:Uncharacterized protein n=1 Tax=Mycena chlorophos TaxID=658473 RepID=A0ABQ0LMT7_MYCCL|nr:predicted protein [Mycena chlorophos]